MKQQLQSILSVILIAGCASCSQFRDSIQDTFNGSPHSNKSSSNGRTVESGSSSSSSVTVEYSSSTSRISINSKQTGTGFLRDAARLKAAEQALRNLPAFSGKKIYLYSFIHFYDDGRIQLQLQNPENPAYVDEYNFSDGAWGTPGPVQLSVHDDIRSALVSLDDVGFVNVAAVYQHYHEKAATVTGAEPPTHIYAIFSNNNMTWYPQSINGSRERYFISFAPDGGLKSFYRE